MGRLSSNYGMLALNVDEYFIEGDTVPKRLAIILMMPLILFSFIQDIVANELLTITVDNASQIEQLSSIGGALQGRLVWSPDNSHLAVGTSEEIQVYDSQSLDTPPKIIDVAGTNFSFNESG